MQIVETPRSYKITFDFDRLKISAVKAIQGAWFHRPTKSWYVPKYRIQEINNLRQRFGVTEFSAPIEHIEEMYEMPSELPDLEIELNLPRPLFPFQAKGVAYNLKNKRVLIGDQMGLGKTIEAIATIVATKAFPCLVICPSTLKLNWQKEWMDSAGLRSMILSDKVKTSWTQFHQVGYIDVFITNYESLKKYFVQAITKEKDEALRLKHITFKDSVSLFKSVVVDESHRVKDPTTQQSKFTLGIAKGKDYRFLLTGTPVVNKPKDLIAQLIILDQLISVVSHIPDATGRDRNGYSRFVRRYCGGPAGASNLRELNSRMNKVCFYRREKSEVLKDLPAKMRQIILCDISNRSEYNKAENEFVDYLRSVKGCTEPEIRRKLRGQMMVKIGILKQISARGKMNEVQEFVDEILESGVKIILFCHLKEIAQRLKDLYPHAVTIRGDDDMISRQKAVDRFQSDPSCQVIICSIRAAGVGITLTASSRVAFIEFPWTYADCEQCEDRAHRIGQADSVQSSYFLGENTIDRWCYELIQKKKSIMQVITGAKDDVEEQIIDELLNLFNQR